MRLTEASYELNVDYSKIFWVTAHRLSVKIVDAFKSIVQSNIDNEKKIKSLARILNSLSFPILSTDQNSVLRVSGDKIFFGGSRVEFKSLNPKTKDFLIAGSKRFVLKFKFHYDENLSNSSLGTHKAMPFGFLFWKANNFITLNVARWQLDTILRDTENSEDLTQSVFNTLFKNTGSRQTINAFAHELHHAYQSVYNEDFFSTPKEVIEYLKAKGYSDEVLNMMIYRTDLHELDAHFQHGLPTYAHEFVFGSGVAGTVINHKLSKDYPNDQVAFLKKVSIEFAAICVLLTIQPIKPSQRFLAYYEKIVMLYDEFLSEFTITTNKMSARRG